MATADEYAAWIVANQAKKGTPEFDVVARAYQEAKNEQPAVVTAGNALRSIPRQVGLTLRHGAEGLAEVADIVAAPVAGVYNTVANAVSSPTLSGQVTGEKGFRFSANPTRTATTGVLDAIGVPKPENATERVAGDVTKLMSGGGALVKGATKVAQTVSEPVAKTVATTLGQNAGTQIAAAGGSGAAGGSVREAGGSPVEEFGASLVGGVTTAGLSTLAVKAYNGIANALGQLITPKSSMQQINVTLNQILEQNGIDVSQLPGVVRGELAHEVKRAVDTGKQLNPDVVRRIADYGVVGATPTRGTVTLDPVQLTQEKNLAKLGANSRDPKLQELARVQNTNNAKFIENLNDLGGNTPNANPLVAGEKAIRAVTGPDAAAKKFENVLYSKARDSSGRAIELDSGGFVSQAYDNLAKANKGAFLPAEIQTVLDQIAAGKMKIGGKEYDVPFTVDTIDNLKTMIAAATRSSSDGNARAALAQVRNALENVQPRAAGSKVVEGSTIDLKGNGIPQMEAAEAASTASMKAFDEARNFARGRRTWQESAPGITAALDDAKPDTFVREYILSGSNKAAKADVEKLMFTINKDPQAKQAVKENVVGYLKSKALGNASDEVGNFSQSSYNNALKELENKLHLFFNKDEIFQLKALGRVASYEMTQPKGSAVGNSNTGAVVGGMGLKVLDWIAGNKWVSRIPFAESAVQGPARSWSAQISTDRALDAGGAMARAPQTAEVKRLEQLFGPALLLAAPRSEGRNDEKRR